MTNTRDLTQFGFIEREEADKLLTAMSEPSQQAEDYELGDGVAVEFNPESGNVFLVDEDYNVAMLNDGKLENLITCIYCGAEGFKSELKLDDDGNCPDCKGK